MFSLLESAKLPKPKLSKRATLPQSRKCSITSQLPPPPDYSPPEQPLLPRRIDSTERKKQIINNRYIDYDRLLEYCKTRFGSGNYSLSYRQKRYILEVPVCLDEEALEQCGIFAS